MISHIHTITPKIAALIGEAESILINQIDYWISKSGKQVTNLDGKWIYNSHQEWLKQFSYWSLSKLRRTIKSLETLKLIISVKVNSKKWNQTKWYTINYEKYNQLFKESNLDFNDSKNMNIKSTSQKYHVLKNDRQKNKINVNIKKTVKRVKKITSAKILLNHSKEKGGEKNLHKTTPNVQKNFLKKHDIFMRSFWTDRCVQNEQMGSLTKNNYTKNIFYNNKKQKIQESTIIKMMVKSWNDVFTYSLSPIKAFYTCNNRSQLLDLLEKVFDDNLDLWVKYAIKVNSSKFLMGEKQIKKPFKAVFNWLSKIETAKIIMAGGYGVGDRELDINKISENIAAQEKILISTTREKFAAYIEEIVNESQEQEEFVQYIKNKDTNLDKYGLYKVLKYYDSYSLLHLDQYVHIKNSLYQNYLIKKHIGISNIEINDLVKKKVNFLRINNKNHQLFMKLKTEIQKVKNTLLKDIQSVNMLVQ